MGYLKVTPSSICGFTDGKGSASARKRLHENSYSWIYLLFVIRSQSLIRRFPEPRCKQNPEPQILSPKLPLLRKPNSKNLARQGALLPAALAVLADLLGLPGGSRIEFRMCGRWWHPADLLGLSPKPQGLRLATRPCKGLKLRGLLRYGGGSKISGLCAA